MCMDYILFVLSNHHQQQDAVNETGSHRDVRLASHSMIRIFVCGMT